MELKRKHRYCPIGLNRTQNSHILQIRSDVLKKWRVLCGYVLVVQFTPYIPFFANMNETDPSFNNTSMTYNKEDAWWYYKSLPFWLKVTILNLFNLILSTLKNLTAITVVELKKSLKMLRFEWLKN